MKRRERQPATACICDNEMEERIEKHQKERGPHFTVVEIPYELGETLQALPISPSVILVDCLTVWIGNLLYRYENKEVAIDEKVEKLLCALNTVPCDIFLVTNETGLGIVPENALARKFRDLAGTVNRKIAQKADNVYFCVCGIPITVKGDKIMDR